LIQQIQQKGIRITQDDVRAELCRRSFYYFVQQFWHTIIEEEPVWNWHIEYICGELQAIAERVKRREQFEYPYYIINVPPGSSKSTIASQMYIAWVWTIDPTQRFICGSYAQTIARKDATFTQQIINSDQYKRWFPSVKLTKDAVDLMRNTKNGERYATSTGSGITGIHAHQIVVDDPLNPKEASSDVERQTALDWLTQTLPTRKVDKKVTPTILVMQRLHESDPTGYIIESGIKHKHICLPATASDLISPPECRDKYVDGLLDPVRLDYAVLDEMKKTLGSYGYSGQFDQRPAPADGGIIKRSYFQIIEDTSVPRSLPVMYFLDSAYGEANSDFSAIIAYSLSNGNLYIRQAQQVRMQFPDLVKFIPEFCQRTGYDPRSIVWVEPKASGKSLVQTLRATTNLNIKEDVSPTKDKVARVQDVIAPIESGRCFLSRGGWNQEFIDQCSVFPNGSQDGYVDCLSASGRRAFISGGLKFIG
jgi:predicted phage terminase large subunit-like protein